MKKSQSQIQNNKTTLGGSTYDAQNRLIHANGKAKTASYQLDMAYGIMGEPLTKKQKVDSSKVAQSYAFAYLYENSEHPTAPSQIGYNHYTYDANGKPLTVTNDSTSETREMYWDEDNRLMVLSDNGKTSRYTYNAGGERIIKSHGTMEGVYINGAPQGITFHEHDDYTLYPASIISINKNRFTKHYFIGDKRVASKLGVGKFSNVYGISGNNVTAGQKDYAARMMQIEKQREEYYRKLGTPPGVPTMKGATADPDNTGYGYNTIIGELGDHSVPKGWPQTPKFSRPGTPPGPPVQWNPPTNPEDVPAGYGYVANDTTREETFFYHSDHLGSTSYITDKDANITQFDAYLPYGELLVDEHSSSEDMPYKFNGKELDGKTGLYYYGARYMDPRISMWLGVDPLMEKYPNVSVYCYTMDNPIKLVDPNGESPRRSRIEYRGKGVFGINIENLNRATRNDFKRRNNDLANWRPGEIGINTEIAVIQREIRYESYTANPDYSPVGIDPEDTRISTKAVLARSTGLPDRRITPRTIGTIGGGALPKGAAGGMLLLNIAVEIIDKTFIFSLDDDFSAIREQTAMLNTAVSNVFKAIKEGRIPKKYQNEDSIGAIANYVFQGQNTTKDPNIRALGNRVLHHMGRYDKQNKRYKPLIEE